MIRNLIPVIVALIVSGAFLMFVLKPGGDRFNFIPDMIHQSMEADAKSETSFIKLFDVVVAIFMFMIVYKVVAVLIRKRRT